jgi:phage terminase small subunit
MTKTSAGGLGARQARFIDEYLIDCNGTRAAIAAGYTKRTAAQAAWEVLRNPKVAKELSRRQKLLAERHAVTIDNVISELAKIGFSNAADFYALGPDGKLAVSLEALADPAKAAAVSSIEVAETKDGGQVVKVKLFDKRAALSDLSNHLSLGEQAFAARSSQHSEEETDVRSLALAAISLLAEAATTSEDPTPLQIEGTLRIDSREEFDLDDVA